MNLGLKLCLNHSFTEVIQQSVEYLRPSARTCTRRLAGRSYQDNTSRFPSPTPLHFSAAARYPSNRQQL